MTQQVYKNIIRWGIIIASLFIVSLVLWNTYSFFQQYKDEERIKMEIMASAYKRLNDPDLNIDMELEIQIIESNYNIPMIVTDANGEIELFVHLDDEKTQNKDYLLQQLAEMKSQNQPLVIQNPKSSKKQYIYYNDSQILTNLKYFPLALLLVLILFFVVIYLFSQTNKVALQNKLWTGMAKETAHQIGTPLTSLLGWITILREDKNSVYIADEIEKDVFRLETIANRFSKIGSETPLTSQNIVLLTKKSFIYLKSRSSAKIQFEFKSIKEEVLAETNPELFGWVIENLIKNSVDAMQGKGKIFVSIQDNKTHVTICVIDTGKGIPKNIYKRIFDPGFTTKKRGWGLGLSLSKRIIKDFHQGKIYVQHSEIGKGTTICIKLQKA